MNLKKILLCIEYFDILLINHPEAMDVVSCTYFFVYKTNIAIKDRELISKYIGTKHTYYL